VDILITGFQITCAAALTLGGALTLYEYLMQRNGG